MVKVLTITENDDPTSMAYHFKRLILDAGYPVMKIFAQEHNISYSTLSRYTSGSASNPTLDFLLQMQHALQLPMDIVCKTEYMDIFKGPIVKNEQYLVPLITRQELTRWPDNQEQLLNMAQRRSFITTLINPGQCGFALEIYRATGKTIGLFRLKEAGEILANGRYTLLLGEASQFVKVQAQINKNQVILACNNNQFDGQEITQSDIHSILVQEIIEHLPHTTD